MRNILILIIFMFVFVCVSCSSQNHDSQDEQDSHDFDRTIDEALAEVDEIPDPDVTDNDIQDESPDADTPVECLDLKIQENVIKTNFPFKDKDGNPTFCRPGCDTPTETDPQCVRNIWEWDNWKSYQEYLVAEKKRS